MKKNHRSGFIAFSMIDCFDADTATKSREIRSNLSKIHTLMSTVFHYQISHTI